MNELRIDASPEALEELRQMVFAELGDEADVEAVASQGPGELREPILISLVIALGPQVVEGVVRVVERWLQHRERMRELDLVKMSLLRDEARPVTLDELRELG